ncbi:MAG: DUF4921 family protein [Nitrososphaerales archaeon]
MAELRKDYFLDRFTIISTERANRPFEFQSPPVKEEEKCPFCPGNESQTPPAELVLVLREGSLIKLSDLEGEPIRDWCVRVFPNQYPAVSVSSAEVYGNDPLYSEPAYGYHYIIVATPNHNEAFSQMSVEQWINILTTVQDRVRWLYSKKRVSYVSIFINYGKDAGASQSHPHLQLLTLPRLPPIIEQEALAVQKSMQELGICRMCSILNVESGGPRQILTTSSFVAFCPWAPRHSFEFWIFPKRHQVSFLRTTQKDIKDLAIILRATLGGLAKALNNPSFNLVFHTSSEKKATRQIHWHIEVYPQIEKWAGFERGNGMYIVQVSPERAAEILSSASKRELAGLLGAI